jgi:hypothetical protein
MVVQVTLQQDHLKVAVLVQVPTFTQTQLLEQQTEVAVAVEVPTAQLLEEQVVRV